MIALDQQTQNAMGKQSHAILFGDEGVYQDIPSFILQPFDGAVTTVDHGSAVVSLPGRLRRSNGPRYYPLTAAPQFLASFAIRQDRNEREIHLSFGRCLHREVHSSRRGDLCFWPKTQSSTGVHAQ